MSRPLMREKTGVEQEAIRKAAHGGMSPREVSATFDVHISSIYGLLAGSRPKPRGVRPRPAPSEFTVGSEWRSIGGNNKPPSTEKHVVLAVYDGALKLQGGGKTRVVTFATMRRGYVPFAVDKHPDSHPFMGQPTQLDRIESALHRLMAAWNLS